MKIKMNQVVEFQKFYENIKNMKFPLKTAYKLNRLITQINNEISFYQQKFSEIINEFGKRDENGEFVYSQDGSSIEIIEGRQSECQEKVNELQNLEAEIQDIFFTIDELDGLNLTLYEMNCLLPFIKD